ncbi:hypothetical protein pb186bvf_011587 [Paramecium bursaria]
MNQYLLKKKKKTQNKQKKKMGCTQMKSKPISVQALKQALANGTTVQDETGQYYVVHDGTKFQKVPQLKKLGSNSLYQKRTSRKGSDQDYITQKTSNY